MIEATPVILIVEDDLNTIKVLRFSLVQAGFTNKVLEVHDAREAVAFLLGEGDYGDRLQYPLPQLILLDLKMPGMNGFEFLKWLRNWPPGRFTPVVVLTNSAATSDLARAYAVGASSYLVKGANLAELVEQMTAIGSVWLEGRARMPGGAADSSIRQKAL